MNVKEISIIQLVLPNGSLVLQRRDDNAEASPGLLAFFGGHVEKGESPEQAMKRELQEETSIDISKIKIVHIVSEKVAHPDNPTVFGVRAHLYKAVILSDDFEVFEGQRSETYSKAELSTRQDLAPTARYFVDHYIVTQN